MHSLPSRRRLPQPRFFRFKRYRLSPLPPSPSVPASPPPRLPGQLPATHLATVHPTPSIHTLAPPAAARGQTPPRTHGTVRQADARGCGGFAQSAQWPPVTPNAWWLNRLKRLQSCWIKGSKDGAVFWSLSLRSCHSFLPEDDNRYHEVLIGSSSDAGSWSRVEEKKQLFFPPMATVVSAGLSLRTAPPAWACSFKRNNTALIRRALWSILNQLWTNTCHQRVASVQRSIHTLPGGASETIDASTISGSTQTVSFSFWQFLMNFIHFPIRPLKRKVARLGVESCFS